MIGLQINDTFLDLRPDTEVTMEINTPIYNGGDPTNIPGSFSFPFTVNLTHRNKLLLNHPHRKDNRDKFEVITDVVFYGDGLPIFKGELHIRSATAKTATLAYIINPLSDLKKKKLNEIVDDKYKTDSSTAMSYYMQHTIDSPDDEDVVFLPVFNREWKKESERESGNGEYNFMLHRTQNFYDVDKQKFVIGDPKNTAVTPFIKAKYLINKILEASNNIYVDKFFDRDEDVNKEMNLLYFYNNYSISLQDGSLDTEIEYKNHVPDLLANEALKQFCSLFFLGIFSNQFDGTISLIPLKDVLTDDEVSDWTTKATSSYTNKENNNNTPGEYKFGTDGSDRKFEKNIVRNFVLDGIVDTDQDVPIGSKEYPLYYYVTHQNQVIKSTTRLSVFKYFLSSKNDFGLTIYEIKMIPIFMTLGLKFTSYTYSIFVPEIEIRGRNEFNIDQADNEDTPEGIDIQDDKEENTAGARLMFYRGMQPTKGGKLYPMGSNHTFNFDGDRVGDYSLLLNGDDGILEKWGKEVQYFMENRRTIPITMLLNIIDIINFRPEYKVRIQNMNYLVSKMVITFTMKGLKPTKCTFESVN